MVRPLEADPRIVALTYDKELTDYYDSLNRNPHREGYDGILATEAESFEAITRTTVRLMDEDSD